MEVTGLVSMACFCGTIANGGGQHISDVGTGAQYERLMRWIYVMMIMMITGMSIVKISVGFFLLRFLGHTWVRRIIIATQSRSLRLLLSLESLGTSCLLGSSRVGVICC